MKKLSQLDFVLKRLLTYGTISRNYCLSKYISRLGAIIYILKKDGYKFETYRVKNDYCYKLIGTK